MNRLGSQRGLSLVEATIIMMVLATLTAVIAPTARDYIEEARNERAKKDVETIGSAIQRVLQDTGTLCLSMGGSLCSITANTGRAELLVSGTAVNVNEPTVLTSAATVTATTASSTSLNWAGGTNAVGTTYRELMNDQFVTNTAGYSTSSLFTSGGGPRVGMGWRGAYLTGSIDADPWNAMYQANTVFLAVASDAFDSTGEGQRRGGWTKDVAVISAGSNGAIQTPFDSAATAVGDDILYVVQGTTH